MQGKSPADFKLIKTVKATKLDDGNFKVVSSFDAVSFGVAPSDKTAQAERMIKSTIVTQEIDKTLKVISSDAGQGVSAFLIAGLDAVAAIGYSPTAVKVGDSWNNTIQYNGSPMEVQLTLTSVKNERGKALALLTW